MSPIIKRLHLPKSYPIRTILTLAVFIIAFLWAFQFNSVLATNNIDGSWPYSIASLRHSPQKLGVNVFFNYGPLFEWSVSIVHPLDTWKDFTVGNLYVFALLALAIYTLLAFLKLWAKELKHFPLVLVVAGFALGLNQIDTLFYIFALIAGLTIWREKRIWSQLLMLSGLELFSLYKFSFSLLTLLLCVLMFLTAIRKEALKVSGVKTLAGITLFWLVYSLVTFSLSPINVIHYFHYGIVNAIYYNEYMSLPFSSNFLILVAFCIVVLIGMLGVGYYIYLQRAHLKPPRGYVRLVPLVIITLCTFLTYKEGVTRTDGHVLVFIPVLFMWCGLWSYFLQTNNVPSPYKQTAFLPFLIILLLFYATIYITTGDHPTQQIRSQLSTYSTAITKNRLDYATFKSVRTATVDSLHIRNNDLATIFSRKNLPPKGATVIFWGNTTLLSQFLTNHGYKVLLLPFIQNYAAHPPTLFDPVYIHFLQQHPNAYIFEEETEGSVNEHLPSYQQNNFFEYVVHNYSVIARDDTNRQYFLKPKPAPVAETCIQKPNLEFSGTVGAPIPIPNVSLQKNQYLKMQVGLGGILTLPESILSLAVKAPIYHMNIYNQDDGLMQWRVAKTSLQHGVAVKPLYLNYHDVVNKTPFQLKQMVLIGNINRHGPLKASFSICTFGQSNS